MKNASKKTVFQRSLLGLAVAGSTLMAVPTVEAVPSFARQTNMPCLSCHFQSYPALNQFGRMFKANGYTMMGTQPLVSGDDLSMPSTLNMSVITKLRYNIPGDVDGGRGEIQWPDEAAFLVGGRLSEKAGFLMEIGIGGGAAEGHVADPTVTTIRGNGVDGIPGTADDTFTSTMADSAVESGTESRLLGAKIHFNPTDKMAVVLFGTDALAVGYGFELLNTGNQRSQRPIENRKGMSAAQMLGYGSGAATGLAFVYHTNDLFVNYSHWAPTFGNVNANLLGGLGHYVRVGYMPTIAGWDMGFGLTSVSGTIKVGANDPAAEVSMAAQGVDFQMQGDLAGKPFGFYASYGKTPKSTASQANMYNGSLTDDSTAMGMLAKWDARPGKTSVYVARGSHTAGGTTVSDTTLGVQQMVAQNIKLELFNVNSDAASAGADFTMLNFFAGY